MPRDDGAIDRHYAAPPYVRRRERTGAVRVNRWQASLVLDAKASVGEGPIWDHRTQELVWVDIPAGALHRFDPRTGANVPALVGQPLAAVALRAAGGFVLALRDGFAISDAGEVAVVAAVERENPGTRLNDGACDTAGRFWAGSMHRGQLPGAGSLYRLDADHTVTAVLDGVTISNGIGWSPDNDLMYYVDSPSGGVDVFEFDLSSGDVSNRRRLVTIQPADGLPDGLAIDESGALWVALWDGGQVRRYAPSGELIGIVELPVRQVTKPAFGGPSLDRLYVTTAAAGTDASIDPLAGGLFCAEVGVRGIEAPLFRG